MSVNPLRGYESKGLATHDPPGGALPHGQLHTASESPLPAGSAVSFRPCCIMGRISAKQQPFLLALWCAPTLSPEGRSGRRPSCLRVRCSHTRIRVSGFRGEWLLVSGDKKGQKIPLSHINKIAVYDPV